MKLPRTARKVGFLSEILDSSPLAFVAWTSDGKIISFNRAFSQISGYSEVELRSRQTLNGLMSLDISTASCLENKEVRGDLLLKESTCLPVKVQIHPVKDLAGKIDYFYAFLETYDESSWHGKQLQLALLAGDVGTWHWDLKTNKVSGDKTLRKFFQISDIEVDFNLYIEAIHPEDRNNVLDHLRDILSSNLSDFTLEFRISNPDNKPIWVISRGRVERDLDGTALCTIGVVLDITEKKLYEEALCESEIRYRDLVEMSPDAIYVHKEDRIVFVNPATCILFAAKDKSELIGKSPEELFHPDSLGFCINIIKKVKVGQDVPLVEEKIIRLDGVTCDVEVHASGIKYYGGDAIQVILRDISERKKSEEALRYSESIHKKLAEANLFGVAFLDSSGRIVFINDEMLRMMGYSRAEFDAGKIKWQHNGIDAEVWDQDESVKKPFPQKESVVLFEGAFIHPDGAKTTFIGASALIEQKRGLSVQIAIDLTHIKQIESSLIEARARAEEANQAKDFFLASLSHELRNPLSPIMAAANMIERRRDVAPLISEYLDIIKRNVRIQARLIDDLLDLNKILHGKVFLDKTVQSIHEIINRSSEACADQAREKKVRLDFCLDSKADKVLVDPARLQQVFWNLLSNAIKFSPPDSTVLIRSTQIGDNRIEVSITDKGRGIEKANLEKIFEAFQQGGATNKRDLGGLGLGLTISKQLVILQGGTIEARSEGLGCGATFVLTFPLVASDMIMEESPQGQQLRAKIEGRVLLVEDNDDTANLLKKALEGDGLDVERAVDVKSAITCASSRKFDLLLCDLALPDGSGLDVMRSIGKEKITGIALSGKAMGEDIELARQAGFLIHLKKPIDLDMLESTIKHLLEPTSKISQCEI